MYTCWFKEKFGFDCLGCGFQRSVLALLKGNIIESIHLYLATIPLIVLWLFAGAHIFFKFPHGALIIKVLFILCALLILINYILKYI